MAIYGRPVIRNIPIVQTVATTNTTSPIWWQMYPQAWTNPGIGTQPPAVAIENPVTVVEAEPAKPKKDPFDPRNWGL